jgi:hypothetical protein
MMIKSYSIFAFSLLIALSNEINAQNCNCITDLDEIAAGVKKAASYKDAIKAKGEGFIGAEFAKIKIEISKDPMGTKNCSGYIQKYLRLFNDRHLMLFPDYSKLQSRQAILSSTSYQQTPIYKIDTTNLEFKDPIEGIYGDVGRYLKVALVRDSNNIGQYLGVVISSKHPLWKVNQVKFILKRREDENFDGFFYDDIHFAKYALVQFSNQALIGAEWAKLDQLKIEPVNPFNIPSRKNWDYQKIDEETDYVYLGTFGAAFYKETDAFYANLIPNLKGKKLIIDVRNNQGGGERMYQKFIDFINSGACLALQIAVLQNSNCMSAAEHFILTLRKNKLVRSFGENTSGTLAYGYGNRSGDAIEINTSCNHYKLPLTVTRYPIFKKYENVGIPPDVKLTRKIDWIKQVNDYLTLK